MISLAVAFSFGLSAIVNRRGVELASRLSRLLPARDRDRLHPDDRLVDVGDADALVLGLGRVGSATYSRLRDEYGLSVVGVEHDRTRVPALEDEGFEVVRADATDLEFWTRVQRAGRVKVAVLAMPFHNANLIALARLQAAGFTGKVAAVARYDDDVAELERHGADAVFHLYGSAGFALADHAAEVLLQGRGGGPPEPHPPARPGDERDVLDPLDRRAEPSVARSDPVRPRPGDGLGTRGHADLAVRAAQLGLHRVAGDPEAGGDLLERDVVADLPEHDPLALGQRVHAGGGGVDGLLAGHGVPPAV